MAQEDEHIDREFCYRCHKPRVTCVCATVPRVENRTGIYILQHPRERFHPIGTARFARLGLTNAHVEVHFTEMEDEAPIRRRLPEGIGVLYPSPDSRDLLGTSPADRPRDLLILDGTWSQASSLYRANPWIADLPHFRLYPSSPSLYQIRKSPRRDYVSTIESILHALRALEPDTAGLDELLDAFTGMVAQQAGYAAKRPRRKLRHRTDAQPIPVELGVEAERVVLVAGESTVDPTGRREAFHVAALRLGSGASMSHFIRPRRTSPGVARLGAMGGTPEDLARGLTPEEFRAAWHAFVAPEDVLVSWRPAVLATLHADHGAENARVILKAAYCNRHKRSSGSPDDVIAAENLTLHDNDVAHRPGRQLAKAQAICELLRELLRTDGAAEARQ